MIYINVDVQVLSFMLIVVLLHVCTFCICYVSGPLLYYSWSHIMWFSEVLTLDCHSWSLCIYIFVYILYQSVKCEGYRCEHSVKQHIWFIGRGDLFYAYILMTFSNLKKMEGSCIFLDFFFCLSHCGFLWPHQQKLFNYI